MDWLTNKHWNGNDPKSHYFCFKKHFFALYKAKKGITLKILRDIR